MHLLQKSSYQMYKEHLFYYIINKTFIKIL